MSILESLRQVEREMFDDHHPLVKEPLALREIYAIGYTMLACVKGYPTELVKKQLKREIVALDLPQEFRKTAIEKALHADTDVIYQILTMINQPMYKYMFLLDLYQFASQDQNVTEAEREFLLLFERLLQLNIDEIHFVRGFRLAMLKRDIELASKVVQEAIACGISVPLQELSYFLKGFEYWRHEAPKELAETTVYRAKEK